MTVSNKTSHQGVVRGTVSYGVAGAPTTITIAQLQFIEPERTFPADCASARLRHDSPELHFAQLDPHEDKRIVRAVVVRFERSRFVERSKSNETFRVGLEEKLTTTTPEPGEHRAARRVGYFTELMENARFVGDTAVALVDAEFDMMAYSGGRAGIVLLRASQNQLASALNARAKELVFEPALEITVTVAVLADLLLSWKNVAETIK